MFEKFKPNFENSNIKKFNEICHIQHENYLKFNKILFLLLLTTFCYVRKIRTYFRILQF